MIRQFTTLFAIVAFTSASFAEVTAVSNAEKVCDQQCAKACGSCPIETAMGKLPKLTFLVGTEETCCPEAAAKLATEHKTAIKYVLAKKTFDDKAKATVALADATEQFVAAFTTTKECAESGKFSVAGKELCCSAMAGERAKLAKHAMEKVAMAYVVGDEQCACPDQAAALAKSTGKDKVFLVAGEKTCCATDARVKLARAKYKAAVEALAKADAPTKSEQL